MIVSRTIGSITELSGEIIGQIEAYIDARYTTLKSYSRREIQTFLVNHRYQMKTAHIREYLTLLDELVSVRATSQSILGKLVEDSYFISESSDIGAMATGEASTTTVSETFGDMGGEETKVSTVGDKGPTDIGSSEQVSMSNFLARPVSIYKGPWSVGSPLSLALPVWALFTGNPAVRAKLRNYAFLRGNLKVRISLSGTPFHYAHLLVSPQPFASFNQTIQEYLAGIGGFPGIRVPLLNYLSQSEGSCIMDVRDNMPVDISIPYMSPKPVIRLFSSTSTGVLASNYPDTIDMCDLYLYSINNLGATTTTATNSYVQVYAWMEDVELGTSTGSQMTIVTESNEMVTGPVQRIASRVASWSDAVSKIPFLRPYASAASMTAGGIAKIAALFGWSRPVKNDDNMPVRNYPVTNSVLSVGNSQARRVVLDPLQEVDVGGDVLGHSDDQMVISNISSRMTYVQSVVWSETDVPLIPFHTMRVHPNIVTVSSGGNIIQPTAMAFAVQPFLFWRGDIHIRLDVVCSAFHRGKLGVFFEPNCTQSNLINNSLNLNKQFMQIIDIQETQSMEFVVNWATYREWLKNMPAVDATANTSPLNPATFIDGYVNGYIGIIPFTELQSNSAIDPVYINIYVSSPNLEVNGFTDINIPVFRTGFLESSTNFKAGSVMPLNLSSASHDHINERYFGEKITSFRSLLKRYTLAERFAVNLGSPVVGSGVVVTAPVMPHIQRSYGAPPDNAVDAYVNMFSYLRYAYIGYKGGVRYMMTCTVPSSTLQNDNQATYVGFAPPSSAPASSMVIASGYTYNTPNNNGQSVEYWKTNGGVEFELPFYSNNLFAFSFNSTSDEAGGTPIMEKTWFRNLNIRFPFTGGGDNYTAVYLHASSGEDFTFLRYQGAPYYSVVL